LDGPLAGEEAPGITGAQRWSPQIATTPVR